MRLNGSLSGAQAASDAKRRDDQVLRELRELRVEVTELRLTLSGSELEVPTTKAAALIGVRRSVLDALADEAIASGVAREAGGGQRRHVRWTVARLGTWWRGRAA